MQISLIAKSISPMLLICSEVPELIYALQRGNVYVQIYVDVFVNVLT
jgi:hypothetical protein